MSKINLGNFIENLSHLHLASMYLTERDSQGGLTSSIKHWYNELSEMKLKPEELLMQIGASLFKIPSNEKSYLIMLLRMFTNIAPYLNIEVEKKYITSEGEQAIKINEIIYNKNHVIVHKFLDEWGKTPFESFGSLEKNSIPEKYVIASFLIYRNFFIYLDALCLDFNIDLYNIQKEIGLQIFQRNYSALQSLGYKEILDKLKIKNKNWFSVLEWVTIFYYANETNLLSEYKTIKKGMEEFMNKHNINTTYNTFKSRYYDAKTRINKKNDYPINKLEMIIPFLEINYNQAVTKVQNDIAFLEEENTDY